MDQSLYSPEEQKIILSLLRATLNWINTYGDDEQKSQSEDLFKIYEKYQSENLLERYGWLFLGSWVQLPQGVPNDFHDREEVVRIAREEGARAIFDNIPIGEILDFCSTMEHPGILGSCLAKITNKKENLDIVDAFVRYYKKHPILDWFIRGYSV